MNTSRSKLITILLLFMSFGGCKLSGYMYRAGDCYESDAKEKWQEGTGPIYKVLEVGKYHYRVRYSYSPYKTYFTDTLEFKTEDFLTKLVNCPIELESVK